MKTKEQRTKWAAYMRKYYSRNKASHLARTRKYYLKNKERAVVARKAWLKKNPEKMQGYRKNWKQNNPILVTEYKHQAWARKHGVPTEDCVERLRELAECETCFWCRIALRYTVRTIDHIIPMSRGGSHTPDNIVASCFHCNGSKNRRLPSEWKQLKEAFNGI